MDSHTPSSMWSMVATIERINPELQHKLSIDEQKKGAAQSNTLECLPYVSMKVKRSRRTSRATTHLTQHTLISTSILKDYINVLYCCINNFHFKI